MSYKIELYESLIQLSNDSNSVELNEALKFINDPVYACTPDLKNKLTYGRLKEFILNSIIKIDKSGSIRLRNGVLIPILVGSGDLSFNGLFINTSEGIYFIISKSELGMFINSFLNY
jgi:hypothetical protein